MKVSVAIASIILYSQCCLIQNSNSACIEENCETETDLQEWAKPYARVHPRDMTITQEALHKRAPIPPMRELMIEHIAPTFKKAKDFSTSKKGKWLIGGLAAKAAFSAGFLYYMHQHPVRRQPVIVQQSPADTASQQISLTNTAGALNFTSSYTTSNVNKAANTVMAPKHSKLDAVDDLQ